MRLYLQYLSMQVRAQMQYRVSFWLTVLGQFLVSFSVLLGILFMFARFHEVEGFTLNQVLLCFAVVLMAFTLAECFFRGFDTFSSMIGNGEFDRIMVRPRGAVFQVLGSRIELSRLGRLIQAVVMLGWAIPRSGVIWTAGRVSVLLGMILGGAVLFSSLFLVYASLCFFTTQGLEFMNVLTDGGREFGKYPMSLYGRNVVRFTTFVVPLACVQYYPLLYLLGRSDNLLYALAPLAAAVFALPSYGLWRVGLRYYKSTGS